MTDETYLGYKQTWGGEQLFAISTADQRQHIYTIGKTGSGKTTLLRNLIVHVLYNCLAALLDCQNTSLLGVVKLLVDRGYRAWVVNQVRDPLVRHFWTEEFHHPNRFEVIVRQTLATGTSWFRAKILPPVSNYHGRRINLIRRSREKYASRRAASIEALRSSRQTDGQNVERGTGGSAPAPCSSLMSQHYELAAF